MYIPRNLTSKIQRYLNYFTFALSSFINLFRIEKPDVIIVSSPPVSVLILGFWYAKIKKIKMIIDLRDMWPEAAISLKIVKKGFLTQILERLVLKSYHYSKKILINTEGFRNILINRYMVNPNKIFYLPNGFNIEKHIDIKDSIKLGNIENQFKVFYSGLLGWAQNVELIVKTAKVAQDLNSHIKFLIIGEGGLKKDLEEMIKRDKLHNISIIDYQEKKKLFELMGGCNLGLITYTINDTFRKNIPSKIFDYMFLEKPVLINLKGEASKLIEDGEFGFCLETNDPVEFFKKIQEISQKDKEISILGKNGFEYLKKNFNKKDLLQKLENLLNIDF